MKTEKINLVFWDGKGRKNDMFPDNHRADHIEKFTVWNSDDFSYWILEEWTGSAWFKIYYDDVPERKSDEYRDSEAYYSLYQFNDIHKEWCFYTLWYRLKAVCATEDPYASICFESYDWPENPIMVYKFIDKDHWKLLIYYPDDDVPWFKDGIEAIVSKKDLFEAFYVWFIKQIIKYYDWPKRVFDNDWYFWSYESNLYTFFSKDIDNYLKENWVKDIDELAQKAKDKIKSDLLKVYEKRDEYYNKEDEK